MECVSNPYLVYHDGKSFTEKANGQHQGLIPAEWMGSPVMAHLRLPALNHETVFD